MNARLQIEVAPVWGIIAETKAKIRESLLRENVREALVDFTEIVVSELMENAIKYGSENLLQAHVRVNLDYSNGRITILVSNGIRNEDDLSTFKKVIEKIDATENKESLYVERLMEIMNNPEATGSQFGLYRIVSECGFTMNYSVKEKILEIRAFRDAGDN